MSQLQSVWTSGMKALKGVLKTKGFASSKGNSKQSNGGIRNMDLRHVKYCQVRDCPEPVKAVKCPVCGGEGHRENR